MKKYKIFSLLLLMIIGMSCTDQLRKDELELQESVNRQTSPAFLLSGSIVSISTFMQEKGVAKSEFNAIMLYYMELFGGHVKSQSHEIYAFPIENWGVEYKMLYDTKAGMDVAAEFNRPSTTAALQVLQCIVFEYLSDIHGDIPYSEALDGREGNIKPVFDTQADIYTGLLKTLDNAIATLGSSSDKLEGDLLYNGNKQSWIKFANSLKIRMLVRSYDAFGGTKKAELQAAAGAMYIDDSMDNAALSYEGTAPENSWIWGPNRDSGGDGLFGKKASIAFIESLSANSDPRLSAWIAPALKPWGDAADNYTLTDYYGYTYDIEVFDKTGNDIGGFPLYEDYVGSPYLVQGLRLVYGNLESDDNPKLSSYTKIFGQDSNDLLKATLFEASEVSFCLAEAAKRGWITGDASALYEAGIRNSMERWDIDGNDITTYISANPLPGTSDQDDLVVILTEKWKSMFTQGHQSWFNYRRTGVPAEVGNYPSFITLPFPNRWRYPTVEVDNNNANALEAIERLGGDTQTDEIWLIKGVAPVL